MAAAVVTEENLAVRETAIYPHLAAETRAAVAGSGGADQNTMKPPPPNGKRGFTVLLSVDPNRYCRLMKVK